MKVSFTSILASASLFSGVWSAATPNAVASPDLDLLDLNNAATPKLSAGAALDIVKKLQTNLDPIEKKLQHTAHKVNKKSTPAEKSHAIASAKKDLTSMANAIYQAIEEVSTQSRAGSKKASEDADSSDAAPGGGNASVKALANALKHTLVTVAGTVNTLLASLGLTPLLAFLTPVTASLSGLVLTLIPVVDSLLPVLNVILDGVVGGLSGLLAGLIL